MSKFGNIDLKEEAYGNLTRVYGEVGKENVFDVKKKKVRKYPTITISENFISNLDIISNDVYSGNDPMTDAVPTTPFYVSINGAPFEQVNLYEYILTQPSANDEIRCCYPQNVLNEILLALEYKSTQFHKLFMCEDPEDEGKVNTSNWDISNWGPPEPEDL